MELTRLFDIIYHQQATFPQSECLVKKENGEWIPLSTQEVIDKANLVSMALLKLGVGKGDKVAIISWNRPEWNIVDLGIQQIGAVSVPMYPTITVEDYKYIFTDAEVKVAFAADEELYQKVSEAVADLPLNEIYTFDRVSEAPNWEGLLEGAQNEDQSVLPSYKDAVQGEDLFTIIYTSGTTGNPKGVMLNHRNVVSNIEACAPHLPIDHTSKALSFLPMCHIFERMLVFLYLRAGVSVFYAESMDTIGDNLREVKPHFFTCVPRLLEKVYDRIYARGQALSGIKKKMFFWALKLGMKYDMHKNQGGWYNFQLNLANKLIFSKWREALGGNVVAIVSGSAALQPRLATVFWAARIPVLQGYGLTETSPVVTTNRCEVAEHKIGSSGTVVGDVEVKIAEDGEILVKGSNVMMGYYKNQEATDKVIKDGWFHTGDIGELDNKGFLTITDRKKEIFKTSGGKYIAPQIIENKFKESVLIEQLMVVGENQKFAGALIVPSFEALREYCNSNNIDYTSDEEIVKNPQVIAKFESEKDRLNESFAQWEKIKQIRLLPNSWTVDTGELTPTMKCKRKVVKQKYGSYIDDMYKE